MKELSMHCSFLLLQIYRLSSVDKNLSQIILCILTLFNGRFILKWVVVARKRVRQRTSA